MAEEEWINHTKQACASIIHFFSYPEKLSDQNDAVESGDGDWMRCHPFPACLLPINSSSTNCPPHRSSTLWMNLVPAHPLSSSMPTIHYLCTKTPDFFHFFFDLRTLSTTTIRNIHFGWMHPKAKLKQQQLYTTVSLAVLVPPAVSDSLTTPAVQAHNLTGEPTLSILPQTTNHTVKAAFLSRCVSCRRSPRTTAVTSNEYPHQPTNGW